jgi:hypothetical protein
VVEARDWPAVHTELDQFHIRIALVDALWRAVAGRVVNDEHLVGRPGLRHQRIEGLGQAFEVAVMEDAGGDPHHGAPLFALPLT